ncbi:hypothetical protein ACTFIZ_000638 [Dictyostelium cf. discoideum]
MAVAEYEGQEYEQNLAEQWKRTNIEAGPDYYLPKSVEYLLGPGIVHIWCQHFEIAKLSFHIFEYEEDDVLPDLYQRFKEKNREQLSTCLECSLRYRKQKSIFLKAFKEKFQHNNYIEIVSSIEKVEKARVREHLNKYKDDCNVLIILIHEVVNNVELLEDQELKKRFLYTIDGFVREYSISFGDPNKKVPGIYMMLMASNKFKELKEWASSYLQTITKISMDEIQSVYPVIERLITDLQFNQDNKLNPDSIFSEEINDVWDGIPLFLSHFDDMALLNSFPLQNLLPLFIVKLSSSTILRPSIIQTFLIVFRLLKTNVWREIPNCGPRNFAEILFSSFLLSRNEQTQLLILQLFSVFIKDCCPQSLLAEISSYISELFLRKAFTQDSAYSIKSGSLLLIVDILLNCFSTDNAEAWGKRIVYFSINQTHQFVVPNYTDMPRAIKLMEHSLLYSAIELRKRLQFLLNSELKEDIDRELSNPCDFWFKSIWRLLLASSPKHIPYTTHLILFKIHRILGLINPIPTNPEYAKSPVYECLAEYHELMGKYLQTFSDFPPFALQVKPGDSSVVLDVLDNEQFHKTVFSLLVSPNQKISTSSKKMLQKKYPKENTITQAFKQSIIEFPEQTSRGVLGVFRDFFFHLGFINCLDSINMIFYYSDHLIFILKKTLQVHGRLLIGPCVDVMWSTFQYGLSLDKEFMGVDSTKPYEKVKYMFEWFKDSFSSIGQNGYCSIKDLPSPSFLNACHDHNILLFDSIEQYPSYVRASMNSNELYPAPSNYSTTFYRIGILNNKTSKFSQDFDFLFENVDYIYKRQEQQPIKESQSLIFLEAFSKSSTSNSSINPIIIDQQEPDRIFSIISNHSNWIEPFLNWNALTSTEWFESLIVIIKSLVKSKYKFEKSLNNFIGRIKEMQLSPIQITKIQSALVPPKQVVPQEPTSIWGSQPLPTSIQSSTIKITAGDIVASSLSAPTNTPLVVTKPKPPTVATTTTTTTTSPISLAFANASNPSINGGSGGRSFDKFGGNSYEKPSFGSNGSGSALNNNKIIKPSYSTSNNTFSTGFGNINSGNANGKPYLKKDFEGSSLNVIDEFERNSIAIPLRDKKKTKMLDIGAPLAFKKAKDKVPAHMEDFTTKIDSLHKIILDWVPTKFADDPPMSELKPVPGTFDDLKHYIDIFQPLLIEEFRAQVIRNLDEGVNFQDVTVGNFIQENGFIDVDFELPPKENDILLDDFVLVIQPPRNGSPLNEAYRDPNLFSAFGKVERKDKIIPKGGGKGNFDQNGGGGSRGFIIKVRFYKASSSTFVQQICKIGNIWNIQKVTSLSTISREYMALHMVGKIPLGTSIISPHLYINSNDSISSSTFKIPDKLFQKLRSSLNESQLSAIASTLKNQGGFSLLQGPPGTGKTKTILSLLSVFTTVLTNIEKSHSDPKILVCAPSNAAVDEIALRIKKDGLIDKNGNKFKPVICRIGNQTHIHPSVQDISVESLILGEYKDKNSAIANEDQKKENTRLKIIKIKEKQVEIDKQIKDLAERLKQQEDNKLRNEITKLNYTREKYNNDLKLAKDEERRFHEQYSNTKRNLYINIIGRSQIILSTLSGSGYDYLFTATKNFDLVIVDEAAQAVELSTLIPLRHDVKKCILVGDPQQLPPTTISKVATKFQYEISLFQRLMNCGMAPTVLKTQYRMHPMISKFPSKIFYRGELEDGSNVREYKQDYYYDPASRFGPLVFYDLFDKHGEVRSSFFSLRNPTEVKLAKLIVDQLVSNYPNTKDLEIGVITPYKSQSVDLFNTFKGYPNVEVSTIDGFQGKEKDFVIFSSVRAHSGHSIGFLSDIRRMNVGLTRAKYSMIILGNSSLLSNNDDWGNLVNDIRQTNNCYFPISSKSIDKGVLEKSMSFVNNNNININNNINNNNNNNTNGYINNNYNNNPSLNLDGNNNSNNNININNNSNNNNNNNYNINNDNNSNSSNNNNNGKNERNSGRDTDSGRDRDADSGRYRSDRDRDYDRSDSRDKSDRDHDYDRSDSRGRDRDRNDRGRDRSDRDRDRNERDRDRGDRDRSDRDRSDRDRNDRDRDRNDRNRDRDRDYDDRDRKKRR